MVKDLSGFIGEGEGHLAIVLDLLLISVAILVYIRSGDVLTPSRFESRPTRRLREST